MLAALAVLARVYGKKNGKGPAKGAEPDANETPSKE